MNIFVLDLDPAIAARYHCDRHVVKMVIEYAQLLSSAQRLSSNLDEDFYQITHVNHPCNIWTRESRDNYEWLYRLFFHTAREYEKRYGRIHSTFEKLGEKLKELPILDAKGLTPFAQAMPEKYKCEDVVQAYRNYYMGDKRIMARWTSPATIPDWFIVGQVKFIDFVQFRTKLLKRVEFNN